MIHIYVINGYPESGKDTFVRFIQEAAGKEYMVLNLLTSTPAKEALKLLGWDGVTKTSVVRDTLSELIDLSTNLWDGPYRYIEHNIDALRGLTQDAIVFIHCREPHNIKRYVDDMGARTILINRPAVNVYHGNHADNDIMKYEKYDFTIQNNGTLEEFKEQAEIFLASQEV